MLKIAVLQFSSQVGNIGANVARIIEGMKRASAQGVDLLVTSEYSVSGMAPRSLVDDRHFQEAVLDGVAELERAAEQFPSLYTVVGFPQFVSDPWDGALPYNIAVVLNRPLLARQSDMVPAEMNFAKNGFRAMPSSPTASFEVKGHRVTVHMDDAYAVSKLAESSDVIVQMPSVRATAGNQEFSHVGPRIIGLENSNSARLLHDFGKQLKAVIVSPQALQSNGSDLYVGSSFIAGAGLREPLYALRYQEDFLVAELDVRGKELSVSVAGGQTKKQQEKTHCDDPYEAAVAGTHIADAYDMTIFGLREYMRQAGFKKVVVGCSGGIDSALTLALATQALGPENVLGITMPSRFSTDGSVSDSVVLCKNLGIELIEHPIKELVQGFEAVHAAVHNEPVEGLALENLQARMRGVILMTYSNAHGHLVLSTGNKSEIAVGYFTLYGDSCGGLNLIGDLYKTEVFELSRYVNKVAGRELIPSAIIEKAPSAELAPGQKDQDSLPPYPVLDAIIKHMLSDYHNERDARATTRVVEELGSTEEGQATLKKVRQLLSRSEYKRAQSAPVVRMREKSFGSRSIAPTAKQD